MKKVIAMILVLVLALGLCACGGNGGSSDKDSDSGKGGSIGGLDIGGGDSGDIDLGDDKVTVFVPVSIRIDGQADGLATMTYEEGWEDKTSFTVECKQDTASGTAGYTMTYVNKQYTMEYGDESSVQKIHVQLNTEGRTVKQTVHYKPGMGMAKMEITTSYDGNGRTTAQTIKQEMENGEVTENTVYYTIEERDGISVGVGSQNGADTVMTYDKNFRLVSTATNVNGEEVNRTENYYDENGCLVEAKTFQSGELMNVNKTKYEEVQISEKTALCVPQFVRK